MTRFSPVPTTSVPVAQAKTYLDRKLDRLLAERDETYQQLRAVLRKRTEAVTHHERALALAEVDARRALTAAALANAATEATRREIAETEARLQQLQIDLYERAREEDYANNQHEVFELRVMQAQLLVERAARPFDPHRLALEKDLTRIDTRITLTKARFPREDPAS